MRGLSLGVVLLGVSLVLACGKTNGDKRDLDADRQSGGATATGRGGTPAAAAGVGNTGASTSDAGTGGKSMLPPDGAIPNAVALHKLDLLLMVDNSYDMLEKQRLLAEAVTWLLGPGGPQLPADDIHVGIITSSLGSHGAVGAKDVCVSAEDNDHAQLIGAIRPGVKSFENSGFLAWGPDAEPSLDVLLTDLVPMFAAVNERGCGYEASLEAWFRFLVDPEPPLAIVVPAGGSLAEAQGVDAELLAQRAAFLRPDSVLSVVVLSDENDCSIQDEGYGWLISRAAPMYRATSACQDPNDECCQSCAEQNANAGCPAIASDPACAQGTTLANDEDDLNLRCWDQKRRFGFDLLYPIERYRDALTRQTVFQRSDGQAVANPIFVGRQRHPSQVILTGIVGVPWQDVADEQSLSLPGLSFLPAVQLQRLGRWDVMIGDPDASPPQRATDVFMMETPIDRAVLSSIHENPLVHEVVVPSTSMNPRENAINGHESVNVGNRALQAACIFPLATPKVCDQAAFDADQGCRCFADDLVYNRAVCQPPGGGPAGTTQYFDSASPGIRHLQLLKALGDNAVTASICPKVVQPGDVDYGYQPAMKALARRLASAFDP